MNGSKTKDGNDSITQEIIETFHDLVSHLLNPKEKEVYLFSIWQWSQESRRRCISQLKQSLQRHRDHRRKFRTGVSLKSIMMDPSTARGVGRTDFDDNYLNDKKASVMFFEWIPSSSQMGNSHKRRSQKKETLPKISACVFHTRIIFCTPAFAKEWGCTMYARKARKTHITKLNVWCIANKLLKAWKIMAHRNKQPISRTAPLAQTN